MAYGIKVSKPGEDVFTAGTDNLFMDTTHPLLKIKQSGTGTLSVTDGGSDSDTITHSLGYVPKVFIYGQVFSVIAGGKNSNYVRYPYYEEIAATTAEFEYSISTTQLVISGGYDYGDSSSNTFSYFYYIFYDEY